MTGNLKADVPVPPVDEDELQRFSKALGERPCWAAVSTHDGEELVAARVHRALQKFHPDLLTIIVPRHPRRLSRILRDIAGFDMNVAVRSRGEPLHPDTRIYLADTFGELTAFIAGSAFVIMGGSFAAFGGQNILEVARNGKAVIFGPHMANFQDEVQIFLEREAGLQVRDTAKLCAAIARLLAEPELAEQMGQNGQRLMQNMSDMAERDVDVEGLWTRYGGLVLRRCRQLLRDEEEALDVTQDVLNDVVVTKEAPNYRID